MSAIDDEAQAMAQLHAGQMDAPEDFLAPAIFLHGVLHLQCRACLEKGRQTAVPVTITREMYEKQFTEGQGLFAICPECSQESQSTEGVNTIISMMVAVGEEADQIEAALEHLETTAAPPLDEEQPFLGVQPTQHKPAPVPAEETKADE